MLFIGASEYWTVAIQADPDVLKTYHFGAEFMVAHAGQDYKSAEAYASAKLIMALFSLISLSLIALSIYRNQHRSAVKPLIYSASLTGLSFIVFF